jgi:hypothetical protein
MSRSRIIFIVVCCVAAPGCAVNGVYEDQNRIRSTLLDLYTNQIVDNLIRAFNGLPIVQVDYTNATAQLTIKDTAGTSDMLATSNPGVLKVIAGSTATVVKTTINTAIGNLGVDRANQVSLTATPVTAGDDVYNAYREFLSIPGSLQVTCEPPACGAAHVCKRCGPKYYWVPIAYQRAFLLLALSTTAQRGQPAVAPDTFFSANIIDVLSAINLDNKNGVKTLIVKLDKKIPADTGLIEITVGDVSATAPTTKTPAVGSPPSSGKGPSGAADAGASAGGSGGTKKTLTFRMGDYQPDSGRRLQQSDVITIFYESDQGKKQGFETYLDFVHRVQAQSLPAKIYLSRHRPEVPVVNDVMNRIEFSLQQIQFNQTRLGGGL